MVHLAYLAETAESQGSRQVLGTCTGRNKTLPRSTSLIVIG